MIESERLDELFVAWQASLDQGREASLAQLCGASPELMPELAARIALARRLEAIVRPAAAELRSERLHA